MVPGFHKGLAKRKELGDNGEDNAGLQPGT